jgi:hypothetical protein
MLLVLPQNIACVVVTPSQGEFQIKVYSVTGGMSSTTRFKSVQLARAKGQGETTFDIMAVKSR